MLDNGTITVYLAGEKKVIAKEVLCNTLEVETLTLKGVRVALNIDGNLAFTEVPSMKEIAKADEDTVTVEDSVELLCEEVVENN